MTRYDSALDADYSPSELSGEDDPLEYDSQTDEPEPRLKILWSQLLPLVMWSGSWKWLKQRLWRATRARRWTLSRSGRRTTTARGRRCEPADWVFTNFMRRQHEKQQTLQITKKDTAVKIFNMPERQLFYRDIMGNQQSGAGGGAGKVIRMEMNVVITGVIKKHKSKLVNVSLL